MTASAAARHLPGGPVIAGVLVSALNPAWIMWWSAVGTGYVAMALRRGTRGLTAFFSGHSLSDFTWYGLVAGLVVSGQDILQGRPYVWAIGLCGVLLFGFGLYFVSLGVRQLRQLLAEVQASEA